MQIKKVFRQERKFLISGEQYYRFSRQFAELFKEDSHNGKDGYMVRSLYFDTLGNKDFEEKLAGVECRRKMRLRIYSPQSRTALLEMKQKQGSNQLKRSLTISREHAEELMKGHYEVLLEYSDPFATECYGVLKTNCYIPKVIVECISTGISNLRNALKNNREFSTGTQSSVTVCHRNVVGVSLDTWNSRDCSFLLSRSL